jgi:NADH dehydrogenase
VPLAATLGAPVDRAGRVLVAPDCTVPGHPEVFVLGDLATLKDASGQVVPGVAPAAMQMGAFVARVLANDIRAPVAARPPRPAFRYRNKGSMATIGRSRAVAEIGRLRFSGFPAWIAWLSIHLVFLIGLRNRLSVFLNWVYSYFTYKRGARVVYGGPAQTGHP